MNAILEERRLKSLRSAMQPILGLLDDDSVIEIMLNPDGRIWVDVLGKGMSYAGIDMDVESSERMLRLVSSHMNSELNENKPGLAAKLPHWGARVQATIPPVVKAPCFAIRKPPKIVFSLDDYVKDGIITAREADLLRKAVLDKKNILVSGGTGSGKTTLTNALLKVLAESTNDRLIIIEDNAELQCKAENKLEKLVIPGIYDHRQALMDALRERPDRIIFGEVRDGAALDLLKAWNTGHPGGIATIHADNPALTLDRLCQLIEEVVSSAAPRALVAEAVDVCVSIVKDRNLPAGRKLNGIVSVNGLDASGNWNFSNFIG